MVRYYFGRWDVFKVSSGQTVFTVWSLPLAILISRLGRGLDYVPRGCGWGGRPGDPWYGRRDP